MTAALDHTAPAPGSTAICLLNTPGLVLPGGRRDTLQRKDAALLALLALDAPVPGARVCHLLWPGSTAPQNNLRQRLFRLKAQAGTELVRHGDAGLGLVDGTAVDVRDVLQRAPSHPDALQGELLASLLFDDLPELATWLDGARARWREQRRIWLEQQADTLEAQHQLADALRFAQRLADDEPGHEPACQRLMRLHHLRGDRAAALRAFQRGREALERELGASPGPALLQLKALIEKQHPLPSTGATPRPVSTLRPPRLLGRSGSWLQLQNATASRTTVLVLGEPGIGKTRLLGDFAMAHGDASDSKAGLVVTARPGDALLPYALLARLVRGAVARFGPPDSADLVAEMARCAPELGTPPDSKLDRQRLQQCLAAALHTWQTAGLSLLALDDLHYADDATLELLPGTLNAPGSAPVGWLLGVRSSEVPAELQRWIDKQSPQTLLQITLGPLDAAATEALLTSLVVDGIDAAGWAPTLVKHTGGNPLFLLETVAALLVMMTADPRGAVQWKLPLTLPLPGQVGQLIERRLGQLSAPARQLASVAAVAGTAFSAGLAESVLQRHVLDLTDAWSELEAAQVLRDQGFAHDLIRDAAERLIALDAAKRLHAKVAAYLARHDAAPSDLGRHWEQAEHWTEAGRCYLLAAEAAERASQKVLESELSVRAAACFERAGDPAQAFWAHERQVLAARFFASFEVLLQQCKRLIDLATSREQRGAALEAFATVLVDDAQDELMVPAARKARMIADATGNVVRQFTAAALEARGLARLNRIDAALGLIERYLPMAHSRGKDIAAARALADFGCALMTCDRPHQGQHCFSTSLELANELQDWALSQFANGHMAWVYSYSAEIAKAAHCYEVALSLSGRLGANRQPPLITHAILARYYKELGRYSEALELLLHTLDLQTAGSSYAYEGQTRFDLAGVYLWLGQAARASAVLREPEESATPVVRRLYWIARCRIAHVQGHPAMPLVDKALAAAQQEGSSFPTFAANCEMARCLPARAGAELALRLAAEAESRGMQMVEWPCRAMACDALRRCGLIEESVAQAHRIVAKFETMAPFYLYAPEYWWIAAQAFEQAGDHQARSAALRRAKDWIMNTALPNVPDEFKDSFLHRNPINRAVLMALHA